MQIIGLLGAHRVGKTTLMNAYAEQANNIEALPMNLHLALDKSGYSSSDQTQSFKVRRHIQDILLKYMLMHLRTNMLNTGLNEMITDRTPIDLITYTLMSAERNKDSLDEEDHTWLKNYIDQCIDITNIYFNSLVLVQPGILLIEDSKSAPCDEKMIEDLTIRYATQLINPNLKPRKVIIPRSVLDLTERVCYITRNS